jgi:hypothetical protein
MQKKSSRWPYLTHPLVPAGNIASAGITNRFLTFQVWLAGFKK